MISRVFGWLMLILVSVTGIAIADHHEEDDQGSYLDRPVYEVLDEFRKQGVMLIYSTNLVPENTQNST